MIKRLGAVPVDARRAGSGRPRSIRGVVTAWDREHRRQGHIPRKDRSVKYRIGGTTSTRW